MSDVNNKTVAKQKLLDAMRGNRTSSEKLDQARLDGIEARRRVSAVMAERREQQDIVVQDALDDNDTIEIGDLILIPGKRWAVWKGKHVNLTRTEYLIVAQLASRPDWLFNRNQIMDLIETGSVLQERTVDSHIKRLRRKFRKKDRTFDQIQTRYGEGYCWRHEGPRP